MIADADGVIDPSSWEGLDEGVAEAAALGLARRNAEINGVSTASPLLKLQRAEDGSIIQLHRPPQRAPRQMTTPLRFGSEADRQRTSERQKTRENGGGGSGGSSSGGSGGGGRPAPAKRKAPALPSRAEALAAGECLACTRGAHSRHTCGKAKPLPPEGAEGSRGGKGAKVAKAAKASGGGASSSSSSGGGGGAKRAKEVEVRLSAAEEAAESARTEGKEAVARGVATEVDGILLHMSDKSPTGYKGVGPKDGGYRARYERHHLGVFESAEEAALAFARHALKAEEDERKRGTKRSLARATTPPSVDGDADDGDGDGGSGGSGGSGGGRTRQRRPSGDGDGGGDDGDGGGSEDGEGWEIERIEAYRVVARRQEYLVKWKGYPASRNSWEPAAHLLTPAARREAKQVRAAAEAETRGAAPPPRSAPTRSSSRAREGRSGPSGGRRGGVAASASSVALLPKKAEGFVLERSARSSSGYRGVQVAGERFEVRHGAKYLGTFDTAVKRR